MCSIRRMAYVQGKGRITFSVMARPLRHRIADIWTSFGLLTFGRPQPDPSCVGKPAEDYRGLDHSRWKS
jgi:hypothetical protein